jgi:hypothetical protein
VSDDDLPESDGDVLHAAHTLIADHGDGAWLEATRRYRDCSERGDANAAAFWLRVSTAVAFIQDNDESDPVRHRPALDHC